MNPVLLSQILSVLVTYGPDAYKAVIALVTNANPTKADFEALLQFATQKKYDDYIAAAIAKNP